MLLVGCHVLAKGNVMMTNPTEKRIQASAVRALCGDISDMTLWRWIDKRDFPRPTYIGKRRYWREVDVIEWLEAQAETQGAA
jgi:predicted DNA-binding transcriptional regulator AlpA